MNITASPRRHPSAAALLLLCASATAQERPILTLERTAAAPSAPDLDLGALAARAQGALLFDEAGDGAIWVRGVDYKARFDGAGATIVPFFGSDAPRNFPLAFTALGATLGGELLASADGGAERHGSLVRIDHGAFLEEYELELHGLEQRFVFPRLDRAGELVLRIGVDTELVGSDLGAALRFENELGHVDYGQAFALDATGRKLALDSTLVDGVIELRVPPEFVAAAALPLVIDPLVNVSTIAGTLHAEFLPDVAYDATADIWGVAYVDVWSATDYDIFVRRVTGAGILLDLTNIDFTTTNWTLPAIADSNGLDRFLVCARVTDASGHSDIRGRLVDAPTGAVGGVIQISPQGGYRSWPDVGGDLQPSTASYFCVVWQSEVSAIRSDIELQRVAAQGALVGGVTSLTNSVEWHERPSISNMHPLSNGDSTDAWTVAWQHRYAPADHDIYGAQVNWAGTVLQPKFPIETSSANDTLPAVSTPLEPGAVGAPRPCLVVFERDFGDHDLIGAVLDGATVLTTANLVGGFPFEFWYRDQRTPSVDSDGQQFLVGFDERNTPGGPDPDVYVSSYSWSGSALVPCEVHASFAGSPQTEGEIAVHSMGSAGGPLRRFFGAWVYLALDTSYDVQGGLWEACALEPGAAACAGDGSGTPCPCSNSGGPGRGCRNGFFPLGAVLIGAGEARVSADTLVLTAGGARPNQPGLFFQGDNAINGGQGAWFGDGLRCAGGNVVRLQTLTADGAGVAGTNVPIGAVGGVGAGDARTYQFWYRDPNLSPCGTGFNLTNGYTIVWLP